MKPPTTPEFMQRRCYRLVQISMIGPSIHVDSLNMQGKWAIRTPGFPSSLDEWSRAFRRFRPSVAARRFAPRPLLVLHGDEDPSVPVSDARQLAQSHGNAELNVLAGAGHRLRHDPRAVAILSGWLDRLLTALHHVWVGASLSMS